MIGIADWIKKNQVLSFYILVFVISWPAMMLAFRVFVDNPGAQALFGIVAIFSPAVVASMISYITQPERVVSRRGQRWLVFVAAWLFSWLVLVLYMDKVRDMPMSIEVVLPSGLVALVAAWLLSASRSRISGVRKLLGTLTKPRGNAVWYLVALFCVPVIQLAGIGITRLAGGEVSIDLAGRTGWGIFVFLGLTFFHGFLLAGGINEETGWRGFVLPRLQARLPVVGAVVIIWFLWALWHLPYDLAGGAPLSAILMNRLVFNFVWAVLFAWVYNRTQGSLLAPALFHPAMNTFGNTLPRTDAATALFVILALIIITAERMWKRLPAKHPAVHS